mmetsp:Transcript_39068/g.72327  ORF Transcript_39068/g.72327 Transcript_39068/m.72327 type:complete len:232 (+) Transcript_39068:1935-2630(+)
MIPDCFAHQIAWKMLNCSLYNFVLEFLLEIVNGYIVCILLFPPYQHICQQYNVDKSDSLVPMQRNRPGMIDMLWSPQNLQTCPVHKLNIEKHSKLAQIYQLRMQHKTETWQQFRIYLVGNRNKYSKQHHNIRYFCKVYLVTVLARLKNTCACDEFLSGLSSREKQKHNGSPWEPIRAECLPCILATNPNMLFQMWNKNGGWNNLVPTVRTAHALLKSCANCVLCTDHRFYR